MRTKTLKLLAIDDSHENLTILKELAQDALPGCMVVTALNGPQGIDLARREDPDVILLDIVMPDMDGFEVCQRLKNDEFLSLIPVVFFTAMRNNRETRIKALEVGAEAFLSKPVDEFELVAMVRAMAKIKAANRLQRLEKKHLEALVTERTRELVHELSERKLVEEQLRESEEQSGKLASLLRLMCDNVPDLIWAKDLEKKFIFSNKANCQQLLNTTDTSEPLGKTHMFFAQRERDLHPDDPQWHTFGELCHDSDAITLKHAKTRVFEESGYVQGKFRCLEVYEAPFYDKNGAIIGTVGSARDITERKRTEEELEKHRNHLEELVASRTAELILSKKEAETANLAKSSFLANMSHEIRTPMNAIMGMAFILRREGVSPRQDEHLGKIDSASKHLLGLINNILDLSKIEAGKFALEEAPLTIASLMNNVHSIISGRAQAKGIRLQIESDYFPAQLTGDMTRLQQALLNYAINAIKFSENGYVTLRALKQEENADTLLVRFEVQDTGIGIAQEALPRLFSAFEQADSSMTRKYGGTGLGLAITKRLAELMGGAAGVNSTLGIGSTFWFTARLNKNTSLQVSGTPLISVVDAEKKLREQYPGHRILIVDDDPMSLEVAQLLLAGSGLIVETAEDGVKAVSKANETLYSMILMDMMMPNLDGLAATRQIRKLPCYQDIPILAMTANALTGCKSLCFAAGMNDCLVKPFEPNMLFATILKWLDAL